MKVREGVTVKLTAETLRALRILKVKLNKRSYDEVIRYLITCYLRQGGIET